MEPRYNEVPRDRDNYFVISGFCYKRNPDLTKLPKRYQKLRYIRVERKLVVKDSEKANPASQLYFINCVIYTEPEPSLKVLFNSSQ